MTITPTLIPATAAAKTKKTDSVSNSSSSYAAAAKRAPLQAPSPPATTIPAKRPLSPAVTAADDNDLTLKARGLVPPWALRPPSPTSSSSTKPAERRPLPSDKLKEATAFPTPRPAAFTTGAPADKALARDAPAAPVQRFKVRPTLPPSRRRAGPTRTTAPGSLIKPTAAPVAVPFNVKVGENKAGKAKAAGVARQVSALASAPVARRFTTDAGPSHLSPPSANKPLASSGAQLTKATAAAAANAAVTVPKTVAKRPSASRLSASSAPAGGNNQGAVGVAAAADPAAGSALDVISPPLAAVPALGSAKAKRQRKAAAYTSSIGPTASTSSSAPAGGNNQGAVGVAAAADPAAGSLLDAISPPLAAIPVVSKTSTQVRRQRKGATRSSSTRPTTSTSPSALAGSYSLGAAGGAAAADLAAGPALDAVSQPPTAVPTTGKTSPKAQSTGKAAHKRPSYSCPSASLPSSALAGSFNQGAAGDAAAADPASGLALDAPSTLAAAAKKKRRSRKASASRLPAAPLPIPTLPPPSGPSSASSAGPAGPSTNKKGKQPILGPVQNPFGDNPVMSSGNLTKCLRAIRRSVDPAWIPEVFNDLWDHFGQDGLLNVFLAGIRSRSVWSSVTEHGHVTAAAESAAELVTEQTNLVGLYLDMGVPGSARRRPYFGSSHASKWQKIKGLGVRVTGVALRVVGQHERAAYRLKNPSYHYLAGYPTGDAHHYALCWGMAHEDFHKLLSPLHDRHTPFQCRQALIAVLEGLGIALMSMYIGARTRSNLRAERVRTAILVPSFLPTNRATGLEANSLDLSSEAQARRGKLGGRLGGKASVAARLEQGLRLNEELDKWFEQNPQKGAAARAKGSAISAVVRRDKLFDDLLAGEKRIRVRPPAQGKYKVCTAEPLLAIIEQRLNEGVEEERKRPTVDVAIPVPSWEITARDLVGSDVLVKVVPAASAVSAQDFFEPSSFQVEIYSMAHQLLFAYGMATLVKRSQRKWLELAEWLRIVVQAREEKAADDEGDNNSDEEGDEEDEIDDGEAECGGDDGGR